MSRMLRTLIAATAMIGVAGAANVHAQAAKDPAAKNPKGQVEENRNTNPGGQKSSEQNKSGVMKNQTNTKGTTQNPTQADENRNTNPSGQKQSEQNKSGGVTDHQTTTKGTPKSMPKNPSQADDNRNTNPAGTKN